MRSLVLATAIAGALFAGTAQAGAAPLPADDISITPPPASGSGTGSLAGGSGDLGDVISNGSAAIKRGQILEGIIIVPLYILCPVFNNCPRAGVAN